jgi:hypothetical protein
MAWNDDDYEDDPCDHDDYEIDILDGRCRCMCGHSWYASDEQVNAEIERQRQYCEYEERENRRQWWLDRWDSVKSFFRRRERGPALVSDDDIPF